MGIYIKGCMLPIARQREGLKLNTESFLGIGKWCGRISRYWFCVFCVAILGWAYWELYNDISFIWWGIDAYPTYVAAKLWLLGQSESIYNAQLWIHEGGNLVWNRQMAALGIPNAGTAFVYHPLYLFFASLAVQWLSIGLFFDLLVVINALSLGLIVVESISLSGKSVRQDKLAATLMACLSFPALYSAYLGQNILMTLALFLLGWRFAGAGRTVAAATALMFAVAIKVWTLPLALLVFALRGRTQILHGAAVFVIGLLILPWLVDSQLMMSYFDIVKRLSAITVFPSNNLALRAILARLESPDWIQYAFRWRPFEIASSVRLAEFATQMIVAGLACLSWYRFRTSANGVFVAALSFVLMLPGVCWSHYFVFAIPISCVLFLSGQGFFRLAGFLSLLLLALPWHSVPRSAIYDWGTPEFVSAYPRAVVAVYAIPLAWFVALALLSLRNRVFGLRPTGITSASRIRCSEKQL